MQKIKQRFLNVCLFVCGFRGASASEAVCAYMLLKENMFSWYRTNRLTVVYTCNLFCDGMKEHEY
jgi:hypothetical protein